MQDIPVSKILHDILTEDRHKDKIKLLCKWLEACLECQKKRQLASYHKIEDVSTLFYWSEAEHGYNHLMWCGKNEPVKLDVSGIIVNCFFGPVTQQTNFCLQAPHELLQSIQLAAPGDVNFELALVVIDVIYTVIEQMAGEGDIQPLLWTPFEGLRALVAGTQFLTQCKFMSHSATSLAMPSDLDPTGQMKKYIDSGSHVYTTDNCIKCLDIEHGGVDEHMSKKPCSPVNIRCGQAVEVSISFATVVAGHQKTFLIQVKRVLIVNRAGSLAIHACHQEYLAGEERQALAVLTAKHAAEDPMFNGSSAKKAHTRGEAPEKEEVTPMQEDQVESGRIPEV